MAQKKNLEDTTLEEQTARNTPAPEAEQKPQKTRSKKEEPAPEAAAEPTPLERLQLLIEKGKKSGKLTAKEMMVIDDLNLEQEQLDWFYDQLENNNIDYSGEDSALVLDTEDLLLGDELDPGLKELE